MLFIQAVLLPYIAYAAMAMFYIRRTHPTDSVARVILALCVDVSILGVGVTGGVFASTEVRSKLGEFGLAYGLCAVLIAIFLTGFCVRMKTWDRLLGKAETTQATFAVFAALLLILGNALIAIRYK